MDWVPPNTDGVPLLFGNLNNIVLVQDAIRIDYYGSTGSSTTLNFPAGGLTLSTRDVFIDTGTTFTGTGGLTIGAGRTLGVREGITLARNVNNLGTLAPGLQNGVTTVQSYQQGAAGTLAIDIRGTTVDTHYDKLTVTGAAQLAGKLDVTLLNLFNPKPGDTYTILSAGSITGSFSTLELPALDRFLWTITQSGNHRYVVRDRRRLQQQWRGRCSRLHGLARHAQLNDRPAGERQQYRPEHE